MCNPSMQRQPSSGPNAPRPNGTGLFGNRPSDMQAYLKKKPLTAQEQEQRRSESMAFEAGGFSGPNPYETLPQSRMEGFSQFKIQQNRRRAMSGAGYARA